MVQTPDQAGRVVLYSLAATGVLITVRDVEQGRTPGARNVIGLAIAGAVLSAFGEAQPKLAASVALLILTAAVFNVGADVLDQAGKQLGSEPAGGGGGGNARPESFTSKTTQRFPIVDHTAGSSGGTTATAAAVSTSSDPRRGQVVALARQLIGTPYQWGGASVAGMDCSGLVAYCYRAVGVSLPHYSAAQAVSGEETKNPQPGDIAYFAKAGVVHHVGIYIGGGQMIDAQKHGVPVAVHPLYSDLAGFRSVLGNHSSSI